MLEYARQYDRQHCGRVVKVEDYRFLYEELNPKTQEVTKTYWVMESFFCKSVDKQ